MRIVRGVLTAVLIGIVGFVVYAGWKKGGPNQRQAAFTPGGSIVFDLSAGGYEIRGSNENQIRIELPPDETREVSSHVSVNGSRAKVEIEGPSNNFHATIYIPQRSDLRIDQTIGDLVVSNVEGNKTVGLNIGHMQLQVDNSASRPNFDGSIIIGDLSATNWHVDKGGFFRSFRLDSANSPYAIKAHVDIGQLELVSGNSQLNSHPQQGRDVDENVTNEHAEDKSQ